MTKPIVLLAFLLAVISTKTRCQSSSTSSSDPVVRTILNASAAEVAKKLGKPDKPMEFSKDCDYLPYCKVATYQHDRYEVMFYNDKLKWIQIYQDGIFNNSATKYVGFPVCPPTLSNNFGIWWRTAATRGTATGPLIPFKGLRGICVFPASSANQYKGYMLVMVEKNYNQRF